jgi:Uma2 family endonuclease
VCLGNLGVWRESLVNLTLAMLPPGTIVYPENDGNPMSDNTKQARWIVILYDNLTALFAGVDVFVAADLLWYPVEGEPTIRFAPDVLVVFGRPRGDRGSYRQWEEGDIPVTVVFEILSPNRKPTEMIDKLDFYDEYGVEEFYIYDPDDNRFWAYVRRGTTLQRIRRIRGFLSPRLGIRFEMTQPEMTVYGPDGQRFLTFEELRELRLAALQQVEQARQQADQARQLTARLAELSRKARRGQIDPAELAELERLEDQSLPPNLDNGRPSEKE